MITEPDLATDGWALESAVERHLADPDRFNIPSAEERSSLRVGSRVKLLFLLVVQGDGNAPIQCERMWVTVTEVSADAYVGSLDSLPATSAVLQPGDIVAFIPDHVAAILVPGNLAVLTTESIIHGGQPILFVTHDEDDGGWQFHDGYEPKEEDAMVVSIRQILHLDPSLNELADLPLGWQAWREAPGDPWQREKES
jgi:hypothetical protein